MLTAIQYLIQWHAADTHLIPFVQVLFLYQFKVRQTNSGEILCRKRLHTYALAFEARTRNYYRHLVWRLLPRSINSRPFRAGRQVRNDVRLDPVSGNGMNPHCLDSGCR